MTEPIVETVSKAVLKSASVVPNGIAAAIVNPSTKIAKVLVLADIAWKPNDNEMINVDFSDYSFKKWKNKS